MKRASWFHMFVAMLGLLLAAAVWADRPLERVTPAPRVNKHAVVWRSLEMPKAPHSGDTWINPVDGMEMVFVESGYFHMGNEQVADERPYHKVFVDGYWISRYTVTVAQYHKFCEVAAHPMPVEPAVKWLANSPVVNVDWNAAAAYAKWANGRLPAEAEWEKAARGKKNVYPWGDAWDATRCNNGLAGKNAPMPVGSFPAGASDYGVLDMAGNVAQWCADLYKKAGDETEARIIRGGSSQDTNPDAYRTSRRDYLTPGTSAEIVGFRYVMSAR